MMSDDLWTDPVHGPGTPGFEVQVCSNTSHSRVSLRGDLDLVSAPHLQQVLNQLCRDGYSEIVLDLSQLTFLGAAGLTVFHHIETQLHATNGQLILHQPPPMARRMLAITRLDTILTIQPPTTRNLTCNQQRGAVESDAPRIYPMIGVSGVVDQ